MKELNKSKKLQNVKYAIRGSVMDAANIIEKNGENVLKLNIGNPAAFNFKAPDEILDCMKNSIDNAQGYCDSKGLEKARKSIKEYYKNKNVEDIEIEDIYIGNGVSELILMTMQGLLNKDDEILVPMPDYPLWTASVKLSEGTPIHYICDEQDDWNPSIEDIKSKITKKTKGIVIINPNNPTGAVYPKEILQEIIKIAKNNKLIIFSDEIYDRLVYDDMEYISIASLTNDVPIVTFSGLSKSHMVAGFRIGWMCITGNKKIIKDYIEGLNLLSSMRLCANVPGQNIIEKALKDNSTKQLLKKGGRLYEQREYIYNRLCQIPGITAKKPKAAFYIFPKIDTKKFNIVDDERFVLDFLQTEHVLFVHGTGFNYNDVNHFRLTFLADRKELKSAIDSLDRFLKEYKQIK